MGLKIMQLPSPTRPKNTLLSSPTLEATSFSWFKAIIFDGLLLSASMQIGSPFPKKESYIVTTWKT